MSASPTPLDAPPPPTYVSAADWAGCADLASRHGRTFYFASRFLPSGRRRAILAAYAYCRLADDIVDGGDPADRAATLAALARRDSILVLNDPFGCFGAVATGTAVSAVAEEGLEPPTPGL